jgi:hypothetical protein
MVKMLFDTIGSGAGLHFKKPGKLRIQKQRDFIFPLGAFSFFLFFFFFFSFVSFGKALRSLDT